MKNSHSSVLIAMLALSIGAAQAQTAEISATVTDEQGVTLGAPLDVTADVCWIGYANASLKALIEPHLRRALTRRGLID